MLKRILGRGLKTAAALALTTTAAVMAASEYETGDPWTAVNCICHVVDGDDVSPPGGFRLRDSLLGLGLNAAAMVFWGVLYEGALAATRTATNPAAACAAAATAYVVDYHVVPPRLTPGIEKRLSRGGILAAYAAIAATLAASRLWNPPDAAPDTA